MTLLSGDSSILLNVLLDVIILVSAFVLAEVTLIAVVLLCIDDSFILVRL